MVEKDEQFRTLFELSHDAIMLLDSASFLHCNDATLKIFDCPSIEVFCTKHPSDISPEFQPCGTSSFDLAQHQIGRAMEEGHNRFEWKHKRLSGEEFWAEVTLSQTRWNDENVLQAIVRDISEQKKLQHSLEVAIKNAEIASIAKSEFLAVISHEIRTPIHGVLSAQELLLGSDLTDDQRENATLAHNSARSLLNIINDVLDFSKIEAGSIDIESVAFSPKQVVNDVFGLLQRIADNKSLKLECDFPENTPTYVVSDQTRLQQILINLVSNAVKFTDRGTIKLLSQFTAQNAEKMNWEVQVVDNGIGIEASKQKKIFEMFSQADSSTTRKYGGTGLGLAISKALANLMDGDLQVSSKVGEGSTFTLNINVEICHKDEVDQDEEESGLQRDYQKRMLIAEDNPINQQIIQKQLEVLGIESTIADNGRDAVQIYQESIGKKPAFDIVLMDIQMPIMNGVEATTQLRKLGCTLPVIILTADALKEKREECMNAGANSFLVKPFELHQLVGLFDDYLRVGD
ncbi:MAG: ATP-binding protein [Planctomycetota bacterium]|nr:ATP-binding protein [Planctomycetota bacterium]